MQQASRFIEKRFWGAHAALSQFIVNSVHKDGVHEEWQMLGSSLSMMTGILIFFGLPFGMGPLVPVLMALLVLSVGRAARFSNRSIALFVNGLFFCLMGVSLAAFQTSRLEPSPITPGYYDVSAVVVGLDGGTDRTERAVRLTLGQLTLTKNNRNEGENLSQKDAFLKITVRTERPADLALGDSISLRARLNPPPGPVLPDGFDYARFAYFNKIIAVGYAVSPVEKSTKLGGINSSLKYRAQIARQIDQSLDGDLYGLAVALTVGVRGAISDGAIEDLRTAGLAHLLAISGLHMGLIAGFAFFASERVFAFSPSVGNRLLPKKGAAVVAFGVALLYLLLSGMAVSTIRAFIMVSIALLAVITDRRVLSLRSVALAAITIMVIDPFAVCHVSFQLSFAATAALVRFFETRARDKPKEDISLIARSFHRLIDWVQISFLATLISQLAIAPYALYHFGSVSMTGALANILVMPLMAFFIMPLILVGLLLSSVNGFSLIATPLSYGLQGVFDLAHAFAQLPLARIHTPQMPAISLIAATIGFCCLLIFVKNRGVVLASLAIGVSAILYLMHPLPTLLLAGKGPNIAYLSGDQVILWGGRSDSFRSRSWLAALGHPATLNDPAPSETALPDKLRRRCDTAGCIWSLPDTAPIVAKSFHPFGLIEDCSAVPLIITDTPSACGPGQANSIGPDALVNRGPVAIWLDHASGPRGTWKVSRIKYALPEHAIRIWHQPLRRTLRD